MTIEQIRAWTEFVAAIGGVCFTVSGMVLGILRHLDKRAKAARGEDVDGDPPVVGLAPMAMLAIGGTLLAYLLSQNPQLAKLLPALNPEAWAQPTMCAGCTDAPLVLEPVDAFAR